MSEEDKNSGCKKFLIIAGISFLTFIFITIICIFLVINSYKKTFSEKPIVEKYTPTKEESVSINKKMKDIGENLAKNKPVEFTLDENEINILISKEIWTKDFNESFEDDPEETTPEELDEDTDTDTDEDITKYFRIRMKGDKMTAEFSIPKGDKYLNCEADIYLKLTKDEVIVKIEDVRLKEKTLVASIGEGILNSFAEGINQAIQDEIETQKSNSPEFKKNFDSINEIEIKESKLHIKIYPAVENPAEEEKDEAI
ncbi:MAG: hypothetical protein HRT89_05645 [Lentisphaeria bacterium]|nr:hypothetical protein [Lentisphaeria bacterium]